MAELSEVLSGGCYSVKTKEWKEAQGRAVRPGRDAMKVARYGVPGRSKNAGSSRRGTIEWLGLDLQAVHERARESIVPDADGTYNLQKRSPALSFKPANTRCRSLVFIVVRCRSLKRRRPGTDRPTFQA